MKTKILYLSYNGVMEHLGTSQVLSYLYKLSTNYEYYLISLEKPEDLKNTIDFDLLKNRLEVHGITWHPIAYKTSRLGKKLNFFNFLKTVFQVVREEKIKNVHCRSYATAITALFVKKFYPIKYLFDTRGFAIDERADVGTLVRNKWGYKLGKIIEKKLYQQANGIVILSKIGKETILNNQLFQGGEFINNIEIITTCVDLDRFILHNRKYDSEVVTIGYVGTSSGWYDFDKTVATLVAIMKTKKIKFLIFNNNQYGQHRFIEEKLQNYGIQKSTYQIEKVSFEDMPYRLKEIDIALFYIHPYFSKRASAATKLGEFLASGIPVLTNKNVGDHEYYITNYNVGKILDFDLINSYNFEEIINGLRNHDTSEKCRLLAEKYFSLENGVEKYKEIYNNLFK
jgi:glycosyltransferase involved in cell wall biosynthesis